MAESRTVVAWGWEDGEGHEGRITKGQKET